MGGEWPLETVRSRIADALALMTHGSTTMTRVAVWRFRVAQEAPPCGCPLSRILLSNGSSLLPELVLVLAEVTLVIPALTELYFCAL